MGVSNTMLQQQRASVAATLRDRGAGDLDLTLALGDASGKGRADPAFAAHAEPIVMWSYAVWHGWASDAELARLHEGAQHQCRNEERMWSRVAGPAAAAVATARRLKWAVRSATAVTTDEGHELDLRRDSPASIEHEVHDAVRRWRGVPVLFRVFRYRIETDPFFTLIFHLSGKCFLQPPGSSRYTSPEVSWTAP